MLPWPAELGENRNREREGGITSNNITYVADKKMLHHNIQTNYTLLSAMSLLHINEELSHTCKVVLPGMISDIYSQRNNISIWRQHYKDRIVPVSASSEACEIQLTWYFFDWDSGMECPLISAQTSKHVCLDSSE